MFKVGDKVSHPMWGNGEVVEIADVYTYPVLVTFINGSLQRFSKEGRWSTYDNCQSLYLGHGTFEIKFTPTPEPVYEWQWRMRRKSDGFIQYTCHYISEQEMQRLFDQHCLDKWEIVERDESTKREVK